MSQQLWRLDEQSREAVLTHKARNRRIAELKQDLADFDELKSSGMLDGGQLSWVDMMVKSINHELDTL